MVWFFKNAFSIKEVLRHKMTAERNLASKARDDTPLHAATKFLDHIPITHNDKIALYFPIKDELDTIPLAKALDAQSIELALPVVIKNNAALIFRKWTEKTPLIDGKFGIKVPAETSPQLQPTIILCPLLAFDANGARLGYGGGFYDRTLEQYRETGTVLAVGYGFAAQRLDHLVTSPLDQPLDWMITERDAINFR